MPTSRGVASAICIGAACACAAGLWAVRKATLGNNRKCRRDGRLAALRRALLQAFRDIKSNREWDSSSACILLSGGLDSALVAEVGGQELGLSAAFTVVCSDEATDHPYACASAAAAGLAHHVIRISLPDLLQRYLPLVVAAIKSFDPMSLRNDVAIACALSEASARGYRCAATGDGADELLGGYGFTHGLEPAAWARQRDHMASVMRFGSTNLGKQLGLAVASPFTQPGVVAAAKALSKDDCVAANDAGDVLQGKMPLRRLFPHVSSARRRKDPIEVGCGTTALSRPGYWDSAISDADYQMGVAAAVAEGVALRDKEHLAYYRVFREVFPGGEVPGLPRHGSDPCPKCGYQLSTPTQTFCVTCGHYDPALRTRHDKKQA